VRRWTGIPVCVGLARTKTLAKVANRLAKRNPDCGGVRLLDDPADVEAQLARFDVGDVWGVGRRNAARLRAMGVDTALKLARLPRELTRRTLTVTGLHTVLELGRIPCISFEAAPPPAKSLVSSRSFGTRVRDLPSLEEAVSFHAQRVAEKLRSRRLVAGAVQVFIQTNPHQPDPQHSGSGCLALDAPTAHTPDIHARALRILRSVYRPGFLYQKVGILALDLTPEGRRQLCLDEPDGETRRAREALMRVLDGVNAAYGRGTLRLAASGLGKRPWHMRQAYRSPRFTTSWDELPVAR
jgi:DNA polymerase V